MAAAVMTAQATISIKMTINVTFQLSDANGFNRSTHWFNDTMPTPCSSGA